MAPKTLGERYLEKTKLCKYFAIGQHCPWRGSCMFAHGESEIRRPPARLPAAQRTERAAFLDARETKDASFSADVLARASGEAHLRPAGNRSGGSAPGSSARIIHPDLQDASSLMRALLSLEHSAHNDPVSRYRATRMPEVLDVDADWILVRL
eukprot:TRINITY_DN18112_c0_g1_i1.p1 TRINITY_DN18112_c0_g1~~TRINITY_DN18112_c0_g1_i1.p1  ORF type:complete len:153 (+),score=13.54 TRINITY_DN18112_c0_g1_i1:116-574(+)